MNKSKNYIFLKKNYTKLLAEIEDDIKSNNKDNIKLKLQLLNIILKRINVLLNEIS